MRHLARALRFGLAVAGVANVIVRATPEDEVREAVQRVLDVPRLGWEKFSGVIPPSVQSRALLHLQAKSRDSSSLLERGRRDRLGDTFVEYRPFVTDGIWYPSYRRGSRIRLALTPEGWMTDAEIQAAMIGTPGKTVYVKFMGRDIERWRCLIGANAAVGALAADEMLTMLMNNLTTFRPGAGSAEIIGELDPAFFVSRTSPMKLQPGVSAADIREAKVHFWFYRGELVCFAVDAEVVTSSPRPNVRPRFSVQATWSLPPVALTRSILHPRHSTSSVRNCGAHRRTRQK